MKAFFGDFASDLTSGSFALLRFVFSVSGILALGMVAILAFLALSSGLSAGSVLVGLVNIAAATGAAAAAIGTLKLMLLVAGVIYDATRDQVPFWRA